MRALVTDPQRVGEATYRRFVRRSEVEGMLADHLYAGEPYLALNAVVINGDDLRELAALTETFASAFHKAGQSLAGDVPRLVDMGFPWAAAELLAAEQRRIPLLGRFDFLQDSSGHWWLLEFNADTPSGLREAVVADALVQRALPEAGSLLRANQSLADSVIAAFDGATAMLQPGQALGIVTDAGALEDLAQMAYTGALVRPALRARGVAVVLGDVGNLRPWRRGLALCGCPIAALYRYLPFESLFGSAAFAAIEGAVTSGTVELLNGLYGLLLQHKGLMAEIWSRRHTPLFNAAEREAIGRNLTPTWHAADRCLPEVGELVFKQVFGREGEEVFFGADETAEQTAEMVRRRTYVAQQRIRPQPLQATVQTSLGAEVRRGYATVGCYVADGRFAGFYTRFGDKIITARAKWLATFVERDQPARRPFALDASASRPAQVSVLPANDRSTV